MIFNVGAGGSTDAEKIKYKDSNVGATLDDLNESVGELNESLGGLRFGTDGEGNYGYFGADDSLIPFSSEPILLWENPNTSNSGTSHDVNGYKHLIIDVKYAYNTSSMNRNYVDVKEGSGTVIGGYYIMSDANYVYGSYRKYTITNGVLKFANSGHSGANNNSSTYANPIAIYGIK